MIFNKNCISYLTFLKFYKFVLKSKIAILKPANYFKFK